MRLPDGFGIGGRNQQTAAAALLSALACAEASALAPAFGETPLKEITREAVRTWHAALPKTTPAANAGIGDTRNWHPAKCP